VDSIKREVYGMVKINCENSLQVYGVFQNNLQNTFFILMEQCQGNM
jgi:serine/threonine protein kinase